ncbi:MAG: hypothetical protein JF587_02180 [Catenulisporales bacterium]|nr:hypothetical protein [Catenulisporales bacterium]
MSCDRGIIIAREIKRILRLSPREAEYGTERRIDVAGKGATVHIPPVKDGATLRIHTDLGPVLMRVVIVRSQADIRTERALAVLTKTRRQLALLRALPSLFLLVLGVWLIFEGRSKLDDAASGLVKCGHEIMPKDSAVCIGRGGPTGTYQEMIHEEFADGHSNIHIGVGAVVLALAIMLVVWLVSVAKSRRRHRVRRAAT